MEAARVSAIRGHRVTVYEKENRLGGLLPWVAMIRGLNADCDVMTLADYLKNQITRLGVDIRLGKEFDPSEIRAIQIRTQLSWQQEAFGQCRRYPE